MFSSNGKHWSIQLLIKIVDLKNMVTHFILGKLKIKIVDHANFSMTALLCGPQDGLLQSIAL